MCHREPSSMNSAFLFTRELNRLAGLRRMVRAWRTDRCSYSVRVMEIVRKNIPKMNVRKINALSRANQGPASPPGAVSLTVFLTPKKYRCSEQHTMQASKRATAVVNDPLSNGLGLPPRNVASSRIEPLAKWQPAARPFESSGAKV